MRSSTGDTESFNDTEAMLARQRSLDHYRMELRINSKRPIVRGAAQKMLSLRIHPVFLIKRTCAAAVSDL